MIRHLYAAITNADSEAAANTGSTETASRKRSPRKIFPRIIPLLALVLISAGACSTQLSVRRHTTVGLTDAQATSILNDFGTLVRTSDTATDFACASDFGKINGIQTQPAFYHLDGAVETYAGVANINSQANFNAVIGTPGYVKVVNDINWCSELAPNIIGCAPVPGNSFAVVRFTGNQEGMLWAHEFAHTVGVEHRTGETFLMNESISINQTEIDANECYSLVSRASNNPWTTDGASSGAASGGIAVGNPSDGVLDGDLRHRIDPKITLVEFVRQVYPHGTPMGIASSLFDNSREIPVLLRMLRDPREEASWGNIVAVLGMIGDSSVSPALIDFIKLRAKEVPRTNGTRVLTAAMMGLGYLTNQTEDRTALRFLAEASSPVFWADVPQACGQGWTRDICANQLATAAAMGLALSGSPDGQKILSSGYRVALAVRDTELAQNLAEYMAVNDEIAAIGLRGYYGN